MMIRVGMVGIGSIASAHRRGMVASGRFELVRICGWRNQDRLRSRCAEWGVSGDMRYESLLEDPSIDCIVIASPPHEHAGQAERAMRAGKHVLIEKPVCLTMSEVDRLRQIQAETDLVCMPGHNGLYDPGIERLIAIVQEGSLGEIRMSQFTKTYILDPDRATGWRTDKQLAGGGILLDMGTHFAYLLNALFGLPTDVVCLLNTNDHPSSGTETSASLTARYPNGHLATMTVSSVAMADPHTPWISIGGSLSRAVHADRLYVGENPVHGTERGDNFHIMYLHFADQIESHQVPRSSFDDVTAALRIIQAGYESAQRGGAARLL